MKFLVCKVDIKVFDTSLYEALQKMSLVKWDGGSLASKCHNQPRLTDVSKFRIFQLVVLGYTGFFGGGTVGRVFK